ncbi:uncharacterized protein LOC117807756 [Notolabrus celidotus]|uniref:uncharacterized protein LOC117807756 n=1 Tax=Notolabrus celidotus TaxID=1203425 RepID=UPI00149043DD|nr:uncharacterized protein LOC117807756 [Notolabrus celidotus]
MHSMNVAVLRVYEPSDEPDCVLNQPTPKLYFQMIFYIKHLLLVLLLNPFVFLGLSLIKNIMTKPTYNLKEVSVFIISFSISFLLFSSWRGKCREIKNKIAALECNIKNLKKELREIAIRKEVEQQKDANLMDLGFCIDKRMMDNQRLFAQLDLESVQVDLEELEEKLHSLESVTDKTEEYLNRKNNLLDAKWRLETKIKELQKLLRDTETLQRSLTDKKGFMSLTGRRTKFEFISRDLIDELNKKKKEMEQLQFSWWLII